jgi:ATP-dependent DNA helicase RecQ
VLQLTDEGRQVLRARAVPTLSKPVQRQAAVTAAAIVDSWEGVDPGLFEALRELRRQLAQKASVPAYIVFSDATLRDLARRRPTDEQLLRDVHGIGQQKAATYGAQVLGVDPGVLQPASTGNRSGRRSAESGEASRASPNRRRWRRSSCSIRG